MIKENYGDWYQYEIARPRLSVLHARISFIACKYEFCLEVPKHSRIEKARCSHS